MAEPKTLRADAERNRRRLLDAAYEMFSERGLDVGMGEIAARAGVGRGTLFRNFASKEDLIAAIVSERMGEATTPTGRKLLEARTSGRRCSRSCARSSRDSRTNRAMVECDRGHALHERPSIAAGYEELIGVLSELVLRPAGGRDPRRRRRARPDDHDEGDLRSRESAPHVNPDMAERQFDLVRAALSSDPCLTPLRRAPTVEYWAAAPSARLRSARLRRARVFQHSGLHSSVR